MTTYSCCVVNFLGCSDGDVRLVGSEGSYQGTVEVCYDNLWGLIDDDGWGISDATVVCRQLGFQKAKSMLNIIKNFHYFLFL